MKYLATFPIRRIQAWTYSTAATADENVHSSVLGSTYKELETQLVRKVHSVTLSVRNSEESHGGDESSEDVQREGHGDSGDCELGAEKLSITVASRAFL